MFTKNDLRTGDFIVRSDKRVEMVIVEHDMLLTRAGDYNPLDKISDDLTNEPYNYNIVKVYMPQQQFHCCFLHYHQGKVVFDRTKEVIMTISEIEEKLGISNLKIKAEK